MATGLIWYAYGLGDLWYKALQVKDKANPPVLLRKPLQPYRTAGNVPSYLLVGSLIKMCTLTLRSGNTARKLLPFPPTQYTDYTQRMQNS